MGRFRLSARTWETEDVLPIGIHNDIGTLPTPPYSVRYLLSNLHVDNRGSNYAVHGFGNLFMS